MGRSKVHDRVGPWTEIKNELIDKYANAYTKILSKRSWCRGIYYVDAFAGAPYYESDATGELVPGSTTKALSVNPPFTRYIFNDLDKVRAATLRRAAQDRTDIEVYELDCNEFLARELVPRIPFSSFRRALVILDPYKLDLYWDTMMQLGQSKTVDIILNFPLMDMNRNALRRSESKIGPADANRMTAWWGDESWRDTVYGARQIDLFGNIDGVKTSTNDTLASAYADRLRNQAGFQFVGTPLLMRNSRNAPLYYLMFASQQEIAVRIINDIFKRYR